ncbi:MAG: methylmalonyl-CoA mutase [Candidatus Neomarinimicrobiota bacterium]|nr:MAG: methylmalonyl-CoA mutase [Candidatus Neomarinimicrobiota bacterium]
MSLARKIRVIMAKVSLDGHDRGLKVVTSAMRDAGMEVIYLGPFQTPEKIVKTAMEEDADVIGLSFLSGEHLSHAPKVADLLRNKDIKDILYIVGGVFPRQDIARIKEGGVDEVFLSGTPLKEIIEYIIENVRQKA